MTRSCLMSQLRRIIILAIYIVSTTIIPVGCGLDKTSPAVRPIIDGVEGYHLIVVGGEPEGVAAALAAARNGVSTLLVEEGDALGGLMTLGMLDFIDQNHGPGRILLTQGIFHEFYSILGNAFDIEEAKDLFYNKCQDEQNLTVMLNTKVITPIMDANTIIGLEVNTADSGASQIVRCQTVIDATVDGDVAAAAGAPYTVGGEDYGAGGIAQGATLVFELGGVDWTTLTNHIRNNGNPNSGVHGKAAWGYEGESLAYTPIDDNIRFRGPNIARLRNDNVLINGLIIFGVDAHYSESYSKGIERGSSEIPHIVEFMRENFAGFENAYFVHHASRLYVRETRHFIGEYRLTITDVLENRDHWDRIGHGSYPVDIQSTSPNSLGRIVGTPDIYSIPFRCLVPLKIDQLLIVGRSASYDSLAHGSARVIPIGMVTGEAAGTAVAYSITGGATFREMSQNPDAILWLQNRLKSQGAFIMEYEPPRKEFMDHWAYPGLVIMREMGLASGGYDNDYMLDSNVNHRWELQNRINYMTRVLGERTDDNDRLQIPAPQLRLDTDDVTVGLLLSTAAHVASFGDVFDDAALAREFLIQQGILVEDNLHHFTNLDVIATQGHLHSVLGGLYTKLRIEKGELRIMTEKCSEVYA